MMHIVRYSYSNENSKKTQQQKNFSVSEPRRFYKYFKEEVNKSLKHLRDVGMWFR